MLSIGEFSNICKVSTKTLRYYADIGLLLPNQVNPENGYRYYSIEQLETMLLINRLKSYQFSLDEIKIIIQDNQNEQLYKELIQKKKEIEKQVSEYQMILEQLNQDMQILKQGRSIMSYLDDIDVQLVEVEKMSILSIRKMVQQQEFPQTYGQCFGQLLSKINSEQLTIVAPPMVLFHSQEFTPLGMDTEFAIPIKEYITGTRDFCPGLCLKTILHGAYSSLPSIYTKQQKWIEKEGYQVHQALFEVYVNDPSQVLSENDLITEIYCPVRKIKEQDL